MSRSRKSKKKGLLRGKDGKRPKTARVTIRYEFLLVIFDEAAVNDVLKKAFSKGVISEYFAEVYDAEYGHYLGIVSFRGPPGAKIRKLRDRIRGMVRNK